jgi:hypothetical protein
MTPEQEHRAAHQAFAEITAAADNLAIEGADDLAAVVRQESESGWIQRHFASHGCRPAIPPPAQRLPHPNRLRNEHLCD